MKSLKPYIAGFLTCLILLSAIFISGFAEDALTVLLNKYPIFVNGQEVKISAYNINGFTYLKLADVGKCFDASYKFNEAKKRIEIDGSSTLLATEPLSSTSQSTIPRIEIDKVTEKLIGAEYVEYQGCKEAVQYNNNIYFPWKQVYPQLGISVKKLEGYKSRFYKNDKEYIFDINTPNSCIFVNNEIHYNVIVFKDLIGE
jgi:hypothetical protein